MTARVACTWCADSGRVGRSGCLRCAPGPVQVQLIPPPLRFERPWRSR